MKIRQRIAGILTAMVCTTGVFCSGASFLMAEAETTGTYEDLTYSTVDSDEDGTDDCVEITNCDESVTEVEIPSEIDGLPVTSIGSGTFNDCSNLTRINVSENNSSFTSIDGVLFNKVKTKLITYPVGKTDKEYIIPDSVISIGNDAFYNCYSLESITIPDSVMSIGAFGFFGCTSLASITMPESLKRIEIYTFFGCTSLETIKIPNSVTDIGWFAFCGCTSLESIIIPDIITGIGLCVFQGCTNLESVTLPNSLRSIDEQAFCYCTNLANITIPDSVMGIGKNAFYGTALFDSQTGVKYADNWIVGCDEDVTSADIKDGTKGIADKGFYNCKGITEVVLPDSVKSIGDSAFSNCTALENVLLGSGVASIIDYAFYGCKSLAAVTVPENVKNIEAYAFAECTSLESITIKNPDCEINDYEDTISYTATIYGYKNSTAQTYAEKYDRTFVVLDSENPTETIDSSLVTKYGDLNNDDDVSVSDVVKLNLYLLNNTENPLDAVALANADCVRDGIIDSSDSSLIMNYIAMMVTYDKLGAI